MKWTWLYSSLNILFIALLWDWNENWPFLVLWPLPRFSNLWTYWVQPLTTSSFRVINSSVGILSPPLALFIVILPKAHLTSHSRISDSRWVTTPSWISRSLVISLYSSSVYSCHLFLISSTSVFYHFCPLSCSSLHEMFPWYLQFSWRGLYSCPFYFFPLTLCVVHLRSPSYCSFLWIWKLVIQSCPTICDPVDCNPPGFSVPGILQTRIQEWVAISFSNLLWNPDSLTLSVNESFSHLVMSHSLWCHVWSPPWNSLCTWNSPGNNTGMDCPPPGDLPDPGIKPVSPALQSNFFTIWAIWIVNHWPFLSVSYAESKSRLFKYPLYMGNI